MKKIISFFIIIIFVLSILPVYSELPDFSINEIINNKLQNSSKKNIINFLNKQKKYNKKIISEIEELIGKSKDENDRIILTNSLEYVQGLSFQYHKIELEIEKTEEVSLKLPLLPKPPYSLSLFDKIVEFKLKLKSILLKEKNLNLNLSQKISDIETNLKSTIFEYMTLKKEDKNIYYAYEKLGIILSYRAELLLSRLRNSKSMKKLKILKKYKNDSNLLLETCFQKLKILKKDVDIANKDLKKNEIELVKSLQKIENKKIKLNKKIMRLELKLENYFSAKNSDKTGYDKARNDIESKIESVKLKLNILNQEKEKIKLENLEKEFRYEWLSSYFQLSFKKTPQTFIKKWQKKIETSKELAISIRKKIDKYNLDKSYIVQKIILNPPSSIKKLLDENSRLINKLILNISLEKNRLDSLYYKIKLMVNLMSQKLSWFDNIKLNSSNHAINIWKTFIFIINYPLFSLGNIVLTLLSIVKFIILVLISLFSIKKLRIKSIEFLTSKTKLTTGAINSVTTLGYYFLLIFVFFFILTLMGIDLSQITVVIGALGVGIGFGLQNIVNNFIGGIILLIEQSIRAGDIVNLENGLTGKVMKVSIRTTVIRTINGDDVIVPNSEFVSGRFSTWTYRDNWRRLVIPFGVSYDADPEVVVKIAQEVTREVSITVEDKKHKTMIIFEGFGDNSLDFSIKVWCKISKLVGHSALKSEYYFLLFKKLKEADISIPFPQQDLHIESISPEILEKLKAILKKESKSENIQQDVMEKPQ